jgi:hypothetical protein
MTDLSKLAALALVVLIAGTPIAYAAGDFNGPFGIVVENPLSGPKPPHPQGPKPPHPQGPKPPHPTTINDLDDALEGFGPAKPVGPQFPSSGKDGEPNGQGGGSSSDSSSEQDAQIDCAVPGAEFAMTNDLLIENVGSVDLPAGAKLKFRVRSSGDRGAFILHRTIGAGKQLLIPGMLHGATAGAACDAQIL